MNNKKRKNDNIQCLNSIYCKVTKFPSKEKILRQSQRIANKKCEKRLKEKRWFNLKDLPFVVLHVVLNQLIGIDAINFLRAIDGQWLCSNRGFAQKFFEKRRPTLINFPIVNQQEFHYYRTSEFVYQFDSSRCYRTMSDMSFSRCQVDRMCSQFFTDAFDSYVRLLPYNVHYCDDEMPLFDAFEIKAFENSRALNDIENYLFKLSQHNQNVKKRSLVTSVNEFVDNLQHRFGYHEWRHAIDFRYFIVAGKCVS